MYSGSQEDTFLLFSVIKVADNDIIAIISGNSLAKGFSLNQMLAFRIGLNISQVKLKFGISVWVAMCNVYGIKVI